MAFDGFDPKWKDFPDFIIGITREIWEGRGIAALNRYYDDNIPMRFPSGLVMGNKAVIEGTLATLAEFPDRQLLGEDVIWSGDQEDGYLSSHRLRTSGTHLGDGYFGAATGKRFSAMTIADCAARNNRIYDEWLIRDSGAIVRQLGGEPEKFARELIEREGGPDKCVKPFAPDQDVDGGYRGKGNDNGYGGELADILTRLASSDIAAIRGKYDRASTIEHAGGRVGHSWGAAERWWMGLHSSFPSAEFEIHHTIGREDPMMPPRAAIRWSLTGRHDGFGLFGRPTGAGVHVMGFTHAEFGPWGLRREWTLYDEISIWKRIVMQTG